MRPDVALFAKPLQRTIEVHRRHAERAGKICLADRKFEAVIFERADRLEAIGEFEEQMRRPLACVSAPDIDRPFAEDRRIDERVEPKRSADVGMTRRELKDVAVADRQRDGRRVRPDAVIRHHDQCRGRSTMSPGIWKDTICRPPLRNIL